MMVRRKGLRQSMFVVFVLCLFFILLELILRLSGWVLLQRRNARFDSGKEDYTIVCLGESTTMLGGKESYPSQLQEILQKKFSNKTIQVVNQGFAGQNSDYILDKLPEILETFQPDLVLAMMGINDNVQFLMQEGSRNVFWEKIKHLRIVKLVMLIKKSLFKEALWKHKKEEKPISDGNKDDLAFTSKKYQMLVFRANYYMAHKHYAEAEVVLRYLFDNEECKRCKEHLRREFIRALYAQGKYDDMIDAMPHIPSWAYEEAHYMEFCKKPQYFQRIKSILDQKIKNEPDVPTYYDFQAQCFRAAGRRKDAVAFGEKAEEIRGKSVNQQTKENYLKLHHMLKQKNIQGVYVQYPMLESDSLKRIFALEPDFDSIIFVDNQAVFKEKVKENGYKRYFSDRFAGKFGHCTAQGNRILAENIAQALGNYIF